MSYNLSIIQKINHISTLQLVQQPYLHSTQTLLLLPSSENILYHGYRHKDNKQDNKTQLTNEKPAEQKPKKKFNFKVSKTNQAKPVIEPSQKCYQFVVQQQLWQSIELKGKTPVPRQNHCVISLNSNIFIIYGGKSLENQKLLNDLQALNIETLVWKKLFSIQCPAPGESNLIVKITDTKILLINFKQIWTFESKDVKWELNTNQLPGGLWENLQIKVDIILDPERQIFLTGINLQAEGMVVFFTVDKAILQLNSYIIDLHKKELTRTKFEKAILIDDIQNMRNLLSCSHVSLNQNQEKPGLIVLTLKKKNIFEVVLLKLDLQSLILKNLHIEQVKLESSSLDKFNCQCFDQKTLKLYFLTTNHKNNKQKCLNSINLQIEKAPQPYPIHTGSKAKQQLTGYLNNSQIQSIPEESNQSSFIGVKYNQNERYQEFQDQPYNENYNQHVLINSERKNKSNSHPSSQVHRSPSVISSKQKSEVSEGKSDNDITSIPDHRNQNENKSHILFSQELQNQNKNTEIQNNVSSFHEEQYLQLKLQKILVFEHLKRQKLEEKSEFLQRSIKSSQNLAKLLTKFATPHQKSHHIEQVKYLKQQLENIWNKEIFFRKQIQQHFINSQRESNLRNSNFDDRRANKEKLKGRIDMKKLLQKHHVIEED